MFESALAYCPASRMADNAVLFKHVARTTGLQHGVVPTFMAKPYGDQPGCSGHVHLSLRDKDGKNVFAVGEDEVEKGREGAPYEDVKRISQVGEWFLAGILAGLPDIVRLAFLSISLCCSCRANALSLFRRADALPRPDRQRVRLPAPSSVSLELPLTLPPRSLAATSASSSRTGRRRPCRTRTSRASRRSESSARRSATQRGRGSRFVCPVPMCVFVPRSPRFLL